MSEIRPCPTCGAEGRADEVQCRRCGGPLTARASEGQHAPVRTELLGPSGRRLLAAVGAVLLLLILGWWLLSLAGQGAARRSRPTWLQPSTVERWARGRWQAAGLPPDQLAAEVDGVGGRRRRVLVSRHGRDVDPARVVRAAASVLLDARGQGPALQAHLAVLELDRADGPRWLSVSLTEAALVQADPAAVGTVLARALASDGAAAALLDAPAGGSPPDRGEPDVEEAGPVAGSPMPAVAQADAADPGDVEGPAASGAAAGPVRAVRVIRGPGRAVPRRVELGQSVVLLRVQLHPGARRALSLKSLSVSARGSLPVTEDVEHAALVVDADRDGRHDDTDRQVGAVARFVGDPPAARFEDLDLAFGADGAPLSLLVEILVTDQAHSGTIMLTLDEPAELSVVELASGARCPVEGAVPLNGRMTTVRGTARVRE